MATALPLAVQEDAEILVGLQKAEFARAAMMRSRALRGQTGLGLASATAAAPVGDVATTLIALLAFVLAAYFAWATWRGRQARAQAERLRRTTLLIGGLGLVLPRDELLDLTTSGFATRQEGETLRDPDYFKSQEVFGARRLAEMVGESAFWTRTLARYAGRETWWLFGGGVMIGFIALGLALTFHSSIAGLGVRLFTVLLVTLLSAEFLGAALAYGATETAIMRISERLTSALAVQPSLNRVLAIVADYNAAVEGMPQFPKRLYDRYRDELNHQYGMWKTGPQPA